MKNNYLLRLLSFSLVLSATSQVWALTPSDGTPDLALYIPGSQANDPAFGFLVNNATVANAVCLANALPNAANDTSADTDTTTHIYFQTAGAASAAVNDNYSAIYCYTDDTKISGLTTGDASNHHKSKLWISRRRLGASFIGLDAVAHGTKLDYLLDPITANCSAYNGSYSSGGATYQWNYSCTTTTTGVSATAATSDVTPDVFTGDNVTPGYQPITASTLDQIFPLGGHIVGIPVTLQLRNALQYAEITSGLLPSTCTVGNETNPACVPSLTKAQLVSIFTGAIADWSQFQVLPSTTSSDGTLPTVVAAGVTAGVSGLSNPLDTVVHICRRENGAGQQVAMLANILQYPCLGSAAPTLVVPDANISNDVEYATSLGAVDKCLTDFSTANSASNGWFGTTNPSPYPNPPAKTVAHGNQWAISIQSTERNATNSAPYRFIAIDGAAPTGLEAYLGHYPLIGNYSLSWKKANNTANQNAALKAIAAYSQKPTTIASRNGTLSNQKFGQAGYIALSDNGFKPPVTWDATNPVTPYSKLASNGKPNACVIPTASTAISNNALGTVQVQLQ